MSDTFSISASQLAKLGAIFTALRWRLAFSAALEHRQVRRVAPEESGTRFVCTDSDGIHACAAEEIDPDQQLDLFDLVPKNRAVDLEDLLATASDSRGVLKDEYWEMLRGDLLIRRASEGHLDRLEEHRQRDALGALFVGVELALDV
ncbi:MAG: hypothetical protein ACKOPF_02690, partial [Candidatus Limnocylindrus sp.]